MSTLFSSLLSWIVQFALFVPFQLLKLAGLLFPTCASMGLTAIPVAAMNSAADWVLFGYPVLRYAPWSDLFNLVSATLLYIFFKWLMNNFQRIMQFVISFWWIIAIFYVVAAFISIFVGNDWMGSSVFTEVFGSGPNASGTVGGGFGGGGGGSW